MKDFSLSDPALEADLAGRRVLVTGASGVVGSSLVPALLSAGAEVLSIYRRRPGWFDGLPAPECHAGLSLDLRETPLPAAALAGVTDCVHLAATLFPARETSFCHDNTTIMQNVAASLARAAPGLGRLVLVSSLAARGPGGPDRERDPHLDARSVSFYGHSKYLSELVATALLPDRVALTILRPGIVLSTADHRLMGLLRGARLLGPTMARRMPRRCSAIAVSDLSSAVAAALEASEAPHGVYEICHPEAIETRDLLRLPPGQKLSPDPMPSGLMALAARLSMSAAVLTGGSPLLTSDKLREARHAEWCGDSSPFTEATGWRARTAPRSFLASLMGSADATT